ncbi:hypothetical protein RhiirA4_460622 [Rhizophagus irregularis]|uniref:Uncharacterized protein n=1 Tax=Rhizophagus irregularis TaxID=588596 RepID=A0A2I1GH10_9GLOM|nr:hypothetical protein RhiirA4_460622 [Rhizophagus irregularis]
MSIFNKYQNIFFLFFYSNVHVKISSVDSTSTLSAEEIDDKVIYMEDLEKKKKSTWYMWRIGNKDIDELIQHSQLNALHYMKCLEWIPFIPFGKF